MKHLLYPKDVCIYLFLPQYPTKNCHQSSFQKKILEKIPKINATRAESSSFVIDRLSGQRQSKISDQVRGVLNEIIMWYSDRWSSATWPYKSSK